MTITRALFDGARIHDIQTGVHGGTHTLEGGTTVYISGGTRAETYTLKAYHKDATNTVHDTAQIHVVNFEIGQKPLYVSKNSTSATLNLSTAGHASGGVTWTSNPPGIAGSGASITFNPSTLAPANYTVTATHNTYTNVRDTTQVNFVAVDVSVAGVDESVEETEGAYLLYAAGDPDGTAGPETTEATDRLMKITIKCEPALPSSETINITPPDKSVSVTAGGTSGTSGLTAKIGNLELVFNSLCW